MIDVVVKAFIGLGRNFLSFRLAFRRAFKKNEIAPR